VRRRAYHAQENTVPQLWIVHGDGTQEELVGGTEAVNDEMSNGRLVERLERACIPYLSQENYW